ncbi:MAG: UDP-galactose-lipid carrier transferase [Armatimonadetes bacterium]|jgi:PPK2 family polyphosphate:nucleotide phosphotransferase|nr:UDP-galactose-lipid carrier transferase [Armatimonadota bacterium]
MPGAYRVDGTQRVRLDDIDPRQKNGLDKESARRRTDELGTELCELADLLFYASDHSLLILLQGRDSSGKDGTIRRILTYSNVQSLRVEFFKVPSLEEMAHDFLWRVHQRTPGRGHVTIFNRSHYEDVLVPRVHHLLPESVIRKRYDHINHFEELLHDNHTIVLKFFLHISKEEQEERLLDREKETEKAWKLAVADWREREYWDAYTTANEEAINHCSRPHSPWFIVPADQKWYRDLVVVEQIVETLRPFRDDWMASLAETGKKARKELEEYRRISESKK